MEEKRPDEKLGDFIARVRADRGLSVEELSVATRVSIAYVKAIEAGDWKSFPVAAYVRGYLRSISNKLNLDLQQVLRAYAAECGNPIQDESVDVSTGNVIPPLNEGENKKKSLVVPVVILLLVVAFLVASHFLDLQSLTDRSAPEQSAGDAPAVVDETPVNQEMPEGAEAVPVDSLAGDSSKTDSAVKSSAADTSLSQAVVDEAVKKSDLPASATIFISSDSKKDSAQVAKTNKTNFVLVGSGQALSWVGLKRREDSSTFLKEANIAKAGVKMVYNTNDTLCVTIGDPSAISKMLLNGVETPLPEMKAGRVTRFRVYGGVIVK